MADAAHGAASVHSSAPAPRRAGGPPIDIPIPPPVRAAIQKAATATAQRAGVIVAVGAGAAIVLGQVASDFGFVAFVAALMIILYFGGSTIVRALNLWRTRAATSMVRVVGTVTVTRHRANKTHHHFVHLADGTGIKVDRALHNKLASAGEVRFKEAGLFDFDPDRVTPDGFLLSQYELHAATTTYVPFSELILEIRNPFGATVYRDPLLHDGGLEPSEPTT